MSEVHQKVCALTHFKAVAHSINHTQTGIRIILDRQQNRQITSDHY